MNKRDLKKFESLLLQERHRLATGIERLEEGSLYQPASDHVADVSSYAEVGTDNNERETALSLASGESDLLTDVMQALKRIEDGAYGVCPGCSKDIPKKRLEVFPAAACCVECQSKLEKEGSR